MAMREYRLNLYNDDGHIVGPAKIISAENDKDAMAQAKTALVAKSHHTELWRLDRFVGFPHGDP